MTTGSVPAQERELPDPSSRATAMTLAFVHRLAGSGGGQRKSFERCEIEGQNMAFTESRSHWCCIAALSVGFLLAGAHLLQSSVADSYQGSNLRLSKAGSVSFGPLQALQPSGRCCPLLQSTRRRSRS